MADAVANAITTPEAGAVDPAIAAAAAAAASTPAIPDKFKNADGSINTDALLASYTELEKKQGANAEPAANADPAAEAANNVSATEAEEGVTAVLKAAGLELTPFNEEFAKDGKLSDASYTALEAKGFSKAVVDQFIAGAVAQQAAGEAAVADIKAVAGGDEGYASMMGWAKDNLSEAQIAEFNEAVSSGKAGIAKAAVQSMKAAFDASEGHDPALINGNAKVSGEVFRSWSEMEAAMKDPRYRTDPAYTRDVETKAIRSNIR